MSEILKLTFLEALQERKVVIPVIQRDYAQGRETVQAQNIRKAFVQRLGEAARNPAKSLNLDLVYMAEKNKDVWVPVDGQQRLTTLFLFHLYHLEDVSALKRFSYEVRTSSVEFCKEVVENRQTWLKSVKQGQCPLEAICDQAWFLVKWERDPTVMGMLQTLNVIHEDAKRGSLPDGWEANITFWSYLTDEKADEAYCNLNARGKTLTPFENLKAYLDGCPGVTSEWKEKIDGDWLDALWGAVDKAKDPEGACDTALLTLTVAARLVRAIEQEQMAKKEDIQAVLAVLTDPNAWLADEVRDCLCTDTLGTLVQDFGKVACDGGMAAAKWMTAPWDEAFPLINKLARVDDKLTYADLALLYAYWVGSDSCLQWRRVIHNILENATVDSAETLVSAIRAIKKLAEGDLRTELNASTFAQEQCKEEAEKLKLIKDENWRKRIEEAEALPWQKGRINFLLRQSKEEKGKTPSYNLDTFKEVLTYFAGNPEEPEKLGMFENEVSRLKWINQICARVETYCRNNNESANNRFFVPRYVCRKDEWAELKRFLYWKEWNNWQRLLLYKEIPLCDENGKPLVMAPVSLEWRSRLRRVLAYYKLHPDPKNKIPVDSKFASRFGSLQRYWYKSRSRIYLFVNDNITNAICLDDAVDWWFKFYKEHKDWTWRWLTADHGTWISTTGNVGGGKHTFALIQREDESYIQIVDEEYTSEEKPLKPISPKVVFKAMEELVADVFPQKKKI